MSRRRGGGGSGAKRSWEVSGEPASQNLQEIAQREFGSSESSSQQSHSVGTSPEENPHHPTAEDRVEDPIDPVSKEAKESATTYWERDDRRQINQQEPNLLDISSQRSASTKNKTDSSTSEERDTQQRPTRDKLSSTQSSQPSFWESAANNLSHVQKQVLLWMPLSLGAVGVIGAWVTDATLLFLGLWAFGMTLMYFPLRIGYELSD